MLLNNIAIFFPPLMGTAVVFISSTKVSFWVLIHSLSVGLTILYSESYIFLMFCCCQGRNISETALWPSSQLNSPLKHRLMKLFKGKQLVKTGRVYYYWYIKHNLQYILWWYTFSPVGFQWLSRTKRNIYSAMPLKKMCFNPMYVVKVGLCFNNKLL